MDLAINLGCDHLKELEVGANARYRSHAIIGEFLKVLATVIEEQLSHVIKSSFYSLLTDESTDIAVKKAACPSCTLLSWWCSDNSFH